MQSDTIDLYRRAGQWCDEKVAGITTLDGPTPCEEWDLGDLLNHMLDTQRYFAGSARGEDVSPPASIPPPLLTDDPVADFAAARSDVLRAYEPEGMVAKTWPALGIAFSDLMLHGWDLAMASGQDPKMPDDLAEAAYDTIHGLFTQEQREGVFKPELPVPDDATAQQRLLAYTGRSATDNGGDGQRDADRGARSTD